MNADESDYLKLKSQIRNAKVELDLCLKQSLLSKHLATRSQRAAIKASRSVIIVHKLGFKRICPILEYELPVGFTIDVPIDSQLALQLWIQIICPVLRSNQTTGFAGSGKYDFPNVETDSKGKVLNKNGKPLKVKKVLDSKTGKVIGENLVGSVGHITDDYDETDKLEHLRCQAMDWRDMCDIAIDLINEKCRTAEVAKENSLDDTSSGDDNPPCGKKPVAKSKSGSVALFAQDDFPIVNGNPLNSLTPAQYNVVLTLLMFPEIRFTKDELDQKSGHSDAIKILKRLAKKNDDWRSVISLAGTTGKGYAIV